MPIEIPKLDKTIVIHEARFTLGCTTYDIPEYNVAYSDRLIRTGTDYYNSREAIPKGFRMSTAAEELALQLALEREEIDPRQAEVFGDLFGRNPSQWYAWQWTDTGLRVPKGWENGRSDNGKYPRIVLIGNQEVAEILVPGGNEYLVVEWHEFFGIPAETRDIDWPHTPCTTHSRFTPNPPLDELSGHYDVAVARRGDWRHDPVGKCLGVVADYGREVAHSGDSIRLVRSLVP